MNEFYTSKLFKTLYYEEILVFYDEPQIFTLRNEQKDLFLCILCISNYKTRKWLLTQIDNEIMQKLIIGEEDIKNLFEIRKPRYLIKQNLKNVFNEIILDNVLTINKYLPDKIFLTDFGYENNDFKEKSPLNQEIKTV